MSTLDDVGAALDRRLIAPLALPTSGRVVIVPTSVLQGLPWSVLPSLRERPVTVAPSASVWLRGRANVGTGPDVRRTALVAGPDLVHASREVSEIAALCSEPLVLRDPDATATAVLDAMEGASTVHLAVHGTFRSDNPFFSSLQASDGPLTIYDLELLARAPTTVVLPACDAGVAAVRGGDELIGTAAALLSVGVDSIIAPLTIVPDGSVAEMMVDLHRSLLDGVRPSAALASARSAALGRGSPADVAAAHTMVALGTRVT